MQKYHDEPKQYKGYLKSALGLYAAPSLCGHAEATHETFPTFTAALSTRAVDHTPVGPDALPLPWRRDTRLPRLHNESPPTTARLCQQSLTG